MVTLADAVEVDDLVTHQHFAVHGARDLVPGVAWVGVDAAVGLPLEVEAERDAVAAKLTVVDLGRIVDPDRERLGAQGEVLERRLDGVICPEPFRADLERPLA